MGGLKAPSDSEYDVLGLSTRATADEINAAFHQLIDEGGFREGVPLRSQWQRAREIKAAHATLSDPVSRAKYDESLSRVAAAPPAFSDPGEHEVPVAGQPEPEPIAPASLPPAAPSALSAFEWGPGSDGTAARPRHLLVPDLDPPARAEEPVLADANSDTDPGTFTYEGDEEAGDDRERFNSRTLAFAGTGALAAGLLLYVFAPEATRPARSGGVTEPGRSTPVRAGTDQGSPVLAEVPATPAGAPAETPPVAGEGDEARSVAESVATVRDSPGSGPARRRSGP
jgi:hypothetical protein